MKEGQQDIYYILGDDERSLRYSHTGCGDRLVYEVLLMMIRWTPSCLVRLKDYKDTPDQCRHATFRSQRMEEKGSETTPA